MIASPNIALKIQAQCVGNMIKLCKLFDKAEYAESLQTMMNSSHLQKISQKIQNIWQNTDMKSNYKLRYSMTEDNMQIIDENMDYFFSFVF